MKKLLAMTILAAACLNLSATARGATMLVTSHADQPRGLLEFLVLVATGRQPSLRATTYSDS